MENYPENEGRFGDFQKAVYQLGNCSIGLKSTSKATPYGAILGTDQLKDLRGMAQLQAAGVSVVPVDSTGAEIKTSTLYRLAKVTKGQEFELNDKFGPNRQCKGLPGAPGSSDPVMKGLFSAEAGRSEAPALSPSASGGSTFHANLVLRSPEAMLYYLGEVARAQIDGRSKKDSTETEIPVKGQFPVGAFTGPVADTKSVKEYVFFRIDKNAHAPAAVKVDYLGNSYGIPLAPAASDSDRSMQALSLLTQVLMLQNKGTESPSTSNVRLVD
ncbi:hypothetical protein LJR066_006620 [Acidovorax sp. LjRoot66]|uniref:hypothetical protein n=1 Tax=Acidovorax sp. LjRoot66 TaxID=3342334 RepID=UPI003ECF9213